MQIALTPLSPAIAQDGRPSPGRMLRSFTALSLVGLYFLSITFLTLSGLCAMSENSGQHQMLIRDHKVILHHSEGGARNHHSFAAMFSNSGESDHEIAYSDLVNSTQNSEEKRMLALGSSDFEQDGTSLLSVHLPYQAQAIVATKIRHLEATHADFLNQWRHLRLNI
jgi:hypothetical protein